MGFKEQVLKIMAYPYWKKSEVDSWIVYSVLRKIIVEQLGVTDERSIAKWIGRYKTTYVRFGNPLYTMKNNKEVVWQKGLLEDFSIIVRKDDDKFLILKDLCDFEPKQVKAIQSV